jgi:hypothetical protein
VQLGIGNALVFACASSKLGKLACEFVEQLTAWRDDDAGAACVGDFPASSLPTHAAGNRVAFKLRLQRGRDANGSLNGLGFGADNLDVAVPVLR